MSIPACLLLPGDALLKLIGFVSFWNMARTCFAGYRADSPNPEEDE